MDLDKKFRYVKCPKNGTIINVEKCFRCKNHIYRPPKKHLKETLKTIHCNEALKLEPQTIHFHQIYQTRKEDWLHLRDKEGKTKLQVERERLKNVSKTE